MPVPLEIIWRERCPSMWSPSQTSSPCCPRTTRKWTRGLAKGRAGNQPEVRVLAPRQLRDRMRQRMRQGLARADDPAGLSRTSTPLARPEYAHAIPTTMVCRSTMVQPRSRLRATRSLGSSHPWPSSGTPEQRRSPGTFDAALPSTRPSPAGGRRSRRPIMSRFAATGCWVPRRSARSCWRRWSSELGRTITARSVRKLACRKPSEL